MSKTTYIFPFGQPVHPVIQRDRSPKKVFVLRWSGVDFCIEQPKEAGLETYYLGRGVMTYRSCRQELSIPLVEHWQIDIDDVKRSQPAGFWFFGADSDEEPNPHSETSRLKKLGFKTGIAARKALVGSARALRTSSAGRA